MVVVVLVEEEKAIAPLSHCLFLWSDALQVLPRRVSRLSRFQGQNNKVLHIIDKTLLETHNISLHVWIVIRIKLQQTAQPIYITFSHADIMSN